MVVVVVDNTAEDTQLVPSSRVSNRAQQIRSSGSRVFVGLQEVVFSIRRM